MKASPPQPIDLSEQPLVNHGNKEVTYPELLKRANRDVRKRLGAEVGLPKENRPRQIVMVVDVQQSVSPRREKPGLHSPSHNEICFAVLFDHDQRDGIPLQTRCLTGLQHSHPTSRIRHNCLLGG